MADLHFNIVLWVMFFFLLQWICHFWIIITLFFFVKKCLGQRKRCIHLKSVETLSSDSYRKDMQRFRVVIQFLLTILSSLLWCSQVRFVFSHKSLARWHEWGQWQQKYRGHIKFVYFQFQRVVRHPRLHWLFLLIFWDKTVCRVGGQLCKCAYRRGKNELQEKLLYLHCQWWPVGKMLNMYKIFIIMKLYRKL